MTTRVEVYRAKAMTLRQKIIDVTLVLILFALSLYSYLSIGNQFIEQTNNFKKAVLGFDSFAVTRVLCVKSFSPKYHRTTAHPLFALFFKPAGIHLATMLGNERSALSLSAISGSLGLALFYALLRKISLNSLHAFLFSLLLGISTPNLLYNSVPETYSFASTSLILLALVYLFFDRSKTFVPAHLLASVFAAGITTVNLVWSIILFVAKLRKKFPISRQAILLFVFLLGTGFISCGLILLQEKLYPRTKDFFSGQIYYSNIEFVNYEVLIRPVEVIGRKIPHFFIYNVVAPGMVRNHLGLGELSGVKTLTLFTLAAYCVLIVVSFYLIVRFKLFQVMFLRALLFYWLFNVCFYLFYGRQLHLYYSHYTFCSIAAIAFPLSLGAELPRRFSFLLTAILALVIPLLALNNFLFLQDVLFGN